MPSKYRSDLMSGCEGRLVATVDVADSCLCLYPLPVWEQVEAQLRRLPSLKEESRLLQRLLIGNAEDIELDASGRFLLPPRLRNYAELDKKATLVGQGSKFELWNEEAWQRTDEANLQAIRKPGAWSEELQGLVL